MVRGVVVGDLVVELVVVVEGIDFYVAIVVVRRRRDYFVSFSFLYMIFMKMSYIREVNKGCMVVGWEVGWRLLGVCSLYAFSSLVTS